MRARYGLVLRTRGENNADSVWKKRCLNITAIIMAGVHDGL